MYMAYVYLCIYMYDVYVYICLHICHMCNCNMHHTVMYASYICISYLYAYIHIMSHVYT